MRLRLLAILVPASAGCNPFGGNAEEKERDVLSWHDPETGIRFRLTERRGGGFVHTFTHLYAETDGQFKCGQIDDDAYFSHVQLVRYDHWLLVVNEDEVWGGYDYDTGEIVGEWAWDRLPFTIRSQAGTVVAEAHVREQGASPASFPRRPESNMQATRTQPSS